MTAIGAGKKPATLPRGVVPTMASSPALIEHATLPPSVHVPLGYLTLAGFATRYRPTPTGNSTVDNRAWELWIDQLGLDDKLYYSYGESMTSDFAKTCITESLWEREPIEKRRVVEKMAIYLKHKKNVCIHTLPLRDVAFLMPAPPPFHEIERHIYRRPNISNHTFKADRRSWLQDIGFPEACDHDFPQFTGQEARLDYIFSLRPILERKAIESRAKFFKLKANPANPSWEDFERDHEIYPASCFISRGEYVNKRREWLASLGLDCSTFSYVNFIVRYNEAAEVEWNEMTSNLRQYIATCALRLKTDQNPLLVSWNLVEEVFGYSLEHFQGDLGKFLAKRGSWLEATTMGTKISPEIHVDAYQTKWNYMSVMYKWVVLEIARGDKEQFCREYPAQLAIGSS